MASHLRVEGPPLPFVYIARCSDDSLYIGHTVDLAAREHTHNQGHGARSTATRRPVRIIYAEQFSSIKDALVRERQLKGWTIAKKEALVRHDTARLKGKSSRSRKSRHR
jgi:putative endonuclease